MFFNVYARYEPCDGRGFIVGYSLSAPTLELSWHSRIGNHGSYRNGTMVLNWFLKPDEALMLQTVLRSC